MGPLPETVHENHHILVMMDHFSKWCEAFPTKDQKASTFANILLHKLFSHFGRPTVLHSDQGANFESNLTHELCDLMGIAKTNKCVSSKMRWTSRVPKQNAARYAIKVCLKSCR